MVKVLQLWLLACLLTGPHLSVVLGQSCDGLCYKRSPSKPALLESHPRLAKAPDAEPHAPEQLHLAFAGPASYAITWMTYPLDDPKLAAIADADEEAPAAAAAGLSRHLAAAGIAAGEAHLALRDDGLETDALERRRHRRKHKCKHVVAAGGRSVVQYGTKPGKYVHTVESPDPVDCYSSGSYVSGAIHRVVFGAGDEGPLPPNTTIYYRVGDPERAWSSERSFVTAPLVGLSALPYRLGLVGDLGQSDHSVSTLSHLLVSAPQSIVLTGDLSYADGYQPRWDTWQRLVEPHTSSQVWMYVVGNHEIELTNGVKDFLSYETRFYNPYRQSLSPSKLFYSYDVAGAHIIMLGSYAPYNPSSEQYAWLLRDLAAVDRSRTPWVIAVMHAPWYNSNYVHQGEGDAMQEAMEHLMYEYGVDFVFSGHVHAYERHHRVYRGKLDDCAPMHINIGDGGNKEGPDKKWYPQPRYSAFRESSFGHGTLDLLDATRAEWRWHRNQDDGPESSDSVSIVRNPSCKARVQAALAAQRQAERDQLLGSGLASQQHHGAGGPQQQQQGEPQRQEQQGQQSAAGEAREGEQQSYGRPCMWRRVMGWAASLARQLA